jgi:hypothetical protein
MEQSYSDYAKEFLLSKADPTLEVRKEKLRIDMGLPSAISVPKPRRSSLLETGEGE